MKANELSTTIDARGVAFIWLNRPARANALDQTLLSSLTRELDGLTRDQSVRVIVLRGSGRHFCGGADVQAQHESSAEEGVTSPGVVDLCLQLDALDKPTIAVIEGAAVGAGCVVAACCDVAIAGPTAFFAMPEVRIGLSPVPLAPFLVRAIGARRARRYILSGERVDARTALEFGLVHELVEADRIDDAIQSVASEFLKTAPDAFAATKRALRHFHDAAPDAAAIGELERQFRERFNFPEATEGRASFREKRPPSWSVSVISKDDK